MFEKVEFESVWDGDISITSEAMLNTDTGEITDIGSSDFPDSDIEMLNELDYQCVRFGKQTIEVIENFNGFDYAIDIQELNGKEE